MIKLIFNIALLVGFAYLVKEMFAPSRSGGGSKPGPESKPDARPRPAKPSELLVQDPHCGVYLPSSEALKGPDGNYFCSDECLKTFIGKKG